MAIATYELLVSAELVPAVSNNFFTAVVLLILGLLLSAVGMHVNAARGIEE